MRSKYLVFKVNIEVSIAFLGKYHTTVDDLPYFLNPILRLQLPLAPCGCSLRGLFIIILTSLHVTLFISIIYVCMRKALVCMICSQVRLLIIHYHMPKLLFDSIVHFLEYDLT